MPFTRTANVAMYGQGDWSGFRKTVSNSTPAAALRIANADPEIAFFFFCRQGMVLTNPAWAQPRVFQPGDAVFFSGEPWWGGAPQCDGYRKDGLAIAYVGSLGTSDPTVAGRYETAQGLPAVDVVCLFAANLNVSLTSDYVRLAPQVKVPQGGTLAVAHDYYLPVFAKSVAALKAKGILVLLSFLNNHDAAGWSQFNPSTAAGRDDAECFVRQLKDVIDTYGFDGIDIDDEYSDGTAYDGSLAMVTSMMTQQLPGAVISKALYNDSQDFGPTWQGKTLADTLTYGWQMTYDNDPQSELPPYVAAGMAKPALAYGYNGYADPTAAAWVQQNGYAGFMAYSFEGAQGQQVMGQLVDAWMGPGNWNQGQ